MTPHSIATNDHLTRAYGQKDTQSALRLITCGSVDDGKSTLIGRLLLDSRAVLRDQLASAQRSGTMDLAAFTDGLLAEREQGITIDVAWRYFATPRRKFIMGDAPGHEQYTRNMVTAASQADAAVILVDALKLRWQEAKLDLLPQTRRHALLAGLLRVPTLIFAVNKLDAVDAPEAAFAAISAAIERFAAQARLDVAAIVPISALEGHNVVTPAPEPQWCGYQGPTLREHLEAAPCREADPAEPLAFPVQWVESMAQAAHVDRGRRILWGRLAEGTLQVGTAVRVFPSGQTATVVELLDARRQPSTGITAGHSAGVILDRELDISRGDWLLVDDGAAAQDTPLRSEIEATVAWMDVEPLVPGRLYWALHGHRWVKAKVREVRQCLDIQTLQPQAAHALHANEIGNVVLQVQQALPIRPYARSRTLGALILVDTATHHTAAAVLAGEPSCSALRFAPASGTSGTMM